MTNPPSASTPAREIPRLPRWDSSLALLADPYRFIQRACRAAGSDVVATRILLRHTLCMTGPDAARLFYDPERFARAGAAPEPLRATLFGKGGVQGLDGAAHRHRKALFLALNHADLLAGLERVAEREWHACLRRPMGAAPVSLYAFAQDWLARSACAWVGLPLAEHDAARRTRQLVALFDRAAAGVRGNLAARLARRRAEDWLAERVMAARRRHVEFDPDGRAHRVAWHHDAHGVLLPPRVAAVELLNVLRPIVAVSVFVVFAAHALECHPASYRVLAREDDAAYLEAFVQEVRRFYPFFPAVAARVVKRFEWEGRTFHPGTRALLDLHGTNHDARSWESPDEFRPARFLLRTPGAFDFVPQGGADAATHHRCPGEAVVVGLVKLAVRQLTRRTAYQVPAQDLRLDLSRLPALPRDRFLVTGLREKDLPVA